MAQCQKIGFVVLVLVSDGELCYDIVRYEAVHGADFCSWCALCRNVVVVRDEATILRIFSCCNPHSGMAFFLLNTVCAVSWVRYSWAGRGAVLLGCFFALLVPFPASVSMNTGMLVWDANLPILWLISLSLLERADEVLDRVDPMVRCSGDRCFGLISYNLELLSLVVIQID